MKFSKKVLVSIIGACLFTGGLGLGVFAGTIIESYKTYRGNIATVEQENIHKNRIGITVNGKEIKPDTWYANGVTYAPIREVANMLGASVNYNGSTQSADIVTESIHGLELHRAYYGEAVSTVRGKVWPYKLIVNKVDTNSGTFEGSMEWLTLNAVHKVEGTLFNNRIVFKETEYIKRGNAVLGPVYNLQLDEKNLYTGTWDGAGDKGTVFLDTITK